MADSIAGAASPSSAIGSFLSGAQPPGAGAEAIQAQLQQTVQQIRSVGDLVQELAATNPMLAQEAQQIAQLLKQMVIKAAQQAPQQTVSGQMVPGGSM